MPAWALGMQGDCAADLPEAPRSIAEHASLPMPQLVPGRDLLETGDVRDGLPHLETALQTDPENLETRVALAKT